MMGYWELTTEKSNAKGGAVELDMDDLGHITELITEGHTSGELNDEDEAGEA